MKANYHTHTHRCYHAQGNDEEYVKSAIKAGFKELGFSDHSPWKYNSSFVSNMRMPLSAFDEYYASIAALKEKYKNDISIKIGLECEYFEAYMPWLKEFIKEKKIDYVILGNHYHQSDEKGFYFGHKCTNRKALDLYVDEAIKAMKTGLYSYLAHPDLFMRAYPEFDKDCEEISYRLCRAAKELHIPLEYNLAGIVYNKRFNVHQYPHPKFWEIAAEVQNDVIIGVDAHHYQHLEDIEMWENAKAYLEKLGLNRIETIEMKDFTKF